MKIEIIAGSLREKSNTRGVALYLKKWFWENTEHEVNIIELSKWNLPFLQKVFVSVDNTPVEFRPLAERMFNADAFILVTPEYNGSYSPALKNLLDHFPKQHRKPFGIVAGSVSPYGGIRAIQQLLLLVPAIFGIASPYALAVPNVDMTFSPNGKLLDQRFDHHVHNFTTEFLWLAEKTVDKKYIEENISC